MGYVKELFLGLIKKSFGCFFSLGWGDVIYFKNVWVVC